MRTGTAWAEEGAAGTAGTAESSTAAGEAEGPTATGPIAPGPHADCPERWIAVELPPEVVRESQERLREERAEERATDPHAPAARRPGPMASLRDLARLLALRTCADD